MAKFRDLLTVFAFAIGASGNTLIAGEIKLYWSVQQDTVIRRSNLDGTEMEDVIRTPGGVIPDIAFDPVEQKMYWPSPAAGGIQRANYDGSDVETVITGIEVPTRVAIDSVHRKAYWIDWDVPNSIWRSDLDGSQRELLVPDAPASVALEVDPIGGYYYWGEFVPGAIHRTSIYDSADSTVIFDRSSLGRTPFPQGLAIDPINGFVYATDLAFEAIVRIGLDGSDPTIWLSEGVSNPDGIVIDPQNQRVIWSNQAHTPADAHNTNISSVNFLGLDRRVEFVPNSRLGPGGWVRHLALVEVPTPEPASLFLVVVSIVGLVFRRTRPRNVRRA